MGDTRAPVYAWLCAAQWLLIAFKSASLSLSLVPSFNLGHVSGDLQARIWHEAAYLSAFVPDSKNLYLSIFWRKIASSPMQCSAHKPFVSCSIFMPSLVFFTPRLLRLCSSTTRPSLCPSKIHMLHTGSVELDTFLYPVLQFLYTGHSLDTARARSHTHPSLTIFTAFIFLLLLFFSPTSRLKIWSSRSAPTSYEDFLSLDFLSAPLPSFRLYYMRSSF